MRTAPFATIEVGTFLLKKEISAFSGQGRLISTFFLHNQQSTSKKEHAVQVWAIKIFRACWEIILSGMIFHVSTALPYRLLLLW